MDIWVIANFCPLQIKPLSIFLYKSFCGHFLSSLLDKYLGEGWLDHMVGIDLAFNWKTLFSKVTVLFYIPISKKWKFQAVPDSESSPGAGLIFLASPSLFVACVASDDGFNMCFANHEYCLSFHGFRAPFQTSFLVKGLSGISPALKAGLSSCPGAVGVSMCIVYILETSPPSDRGFALSFFLFIFMDML